jgi:predicted nucleic acid-binding protein
MVNPRDQWRQAFDALADEPGDSEVVTTEEVLVELLAFFAGRGSLLRTRAVAFVRGLRNRPQVVVLEQSHESFLRGLDLYERRADKGYSLVDCIWMAVMRERGITEVLSGDEHFRQEGFVPLIDPDAS